MKAALIGAGAESLHTIKKAQDLGVEVIALDGNPQAEGLAAADEGLAIDISDEKAVLDALKERKPEFVITGPIGRYLTTAGAVNDALELKGISRDAAVLCTDKYLFHKKLAQRGLRGCECLLVPAGLSADRTENSAAGLSPEAEEFLRKAKRALIWPAILKPRYGSGSRGIFFLNNAAELEVTLTKLLSTKLDEDYVLEEVVNGVEYGVDGAMDGAAFNLILLRKKLITPPPARQAVGYFSVPDMIPGELQIRDKVSGYLTEVAIALGLRNCLLHADLIIRRNKIFVIELSARPSGHYLHNVFTPMATGVDMAESYIRKQMRLPYSYQPVRTERMLIRFFDLPTGEVSLVPTREAVEELCQQNRNGVRLKAWKCNIRPGDIMEPVTTGHSVMGRGYFILSGETEEEMLMTAMQILQLFLS